jgi:hypothetical protein
MRDELHLMELVDRYLDGSMNAEERKAFEARANSNAELRQLVEDQRALREGVARVPVRTAAAKAYRAHRFGKPGPWAAGAVVLAIVVATTMLLWRAQDHSRDSENTLDLNEQYARVLDDTTGTHLDPLVLTIDPNADTTLLTPNGIVLDIPRGAFLDSLGNAITAPVRVTLLEALDPLDIMKAGLSTLSGSTLLETGGMFYFDAQVNGKKVRIDPTKPITAMVPAQPGQEDMQLFQGAKGDDGTIDWQNPQPLKKSLIPVDITTLNFYPPSYEAKLAELGQDVMNKAFKDSLYYSFTASGGLGTIYSVDLDVSEVYGETYQLDTLFRDPTNPAVSKWDQRSGIDPAKIKTLWSNRFNNTNIATREFEERMRAIHKTCNHDVLDMYASALGDDLSHIDWLVWKRGYAEFEAFAVRKDGRVQLPANSADRLRTFYENNSRAEAVAIRNTQEAFWRKQWKQDVRSDAKRSEHMLADEVREGQLFQKELQANMDTVYAQLGLKHRWMPRSAWVVPVVNTGWWNVDIAVIQATTTRTSMSYTDPNSGKTASLTYTPLMVEVEDRASYDELVVYLIPNQLNSYQRMKEGEGGFSEKLNSIFTYDLFCLGMKGKQQFAFTTSASGRAEITASLVPTDENGLRAMLRAKGNVEERLLDESRFLYWSGTDNTRRQANMARQELRSALLNVVFPCAGGDGVPANPDSTAIEAAE